MSDAAGQARLPGSDGLKAEASRLPAALRARSQVADREFLPAALEIIETPASPISMALLLAICALAAAALLWSWIGKLDVVAVASGKIQPAGRVKVIEPLETGRVEVLAVADGQRVEIGDLLLRLDPREAQADVDALTSALASYSAEATRRRAALASVRTGTRAPLTWDALIPVGVRERETLVLDGDIERLNAQLAMLDAQRLQKQAEVSRLKSTVAAQHDLLNTQDTRVIPERGRAAAHSRPHRGELPPSRISVLSPSPRGFARPRLQPA